MKITENDDVPVAFCRKHNKQKAVFSLQGILLGLTADQRLNDTEILFLTTWLDCDSEFKTDIEFIKIQKLLFSVLQDGVITADERERVLDFLNKVNERNDIDGYNLNELTNLLLGFLQGISADDVINDFEVVKLSLLLLSNDALISAWPGNLIYDRISTILDDGVITDDERVDLLDLVKQVAGQSFIDTGLATGMSTGFFADGSVSSISGKIVCFTGKFLSAARSSLEAQAKLLGAEPVKAMSKKVNVLIIGSLASRDWVYTSHGRKIEAAIRSKDEGHDIQIINEEDWVRIASEPVAVEQ